MGHSHGAADHIDATGTTTRADNINFTGYCLGLRTAPGSKTTAAIWTPCCKAGAYGHPPRRRQVLARLASSAMACVRGTPTSGCGQRGEVPPTEETPKDNYRIWVQRTQELYDGRIQPRKFTLLATGIHRDSWTFAMENTAPGAKHLLVGLRVPTNKKPRRT